MSKIIDLVGKKFNKLTVIKRVENNRFGKVCWLCKCDCGNEVIVESQNLRNGHTKSCGCLKHIAYNFTHRKTNTRLFSIWSDIKTRCYNPNSKNYSYYGERGIKVCKEWLDNFMNFYNWSINNGYNENLSIDRINVNGNYCPGNCRWADKITQARNTRKNVFLLYENKKICIAELAELLEIPYKKLWKKIKKGEFKYATI